MFTIALNPGDYNTALKQKALLESDRGKAYMQRLEEVRNTLRAQGIRTLQIQTSRFNFETPCSISNYDVKKSGFKVMLNGGTSTPGFLPGREFKATINGFEIPNISFLTVQTNAIGIYQKYICKIFIPFPENLAAKIEGNRDAAVQLSTAFGF